MLIRYCKDAIGRPLSSSRGRQAWSRGATMNTSRWGHDAPHLLRPRLQRHRYAAGYAHTFVKKDGHQAAGSAWAARHRDHQRSPTPRQGHDASPGLPTATTAASPSPPMGALRLGENETASWEPVIELPVQADIHHLTGRLGNQSSLHLVPDDGSLWAPGRLNALGTKELDSLRLVKVADGVVSTPPEGTSFYIDTRAPVGCRQQPVRAMGNGTRRTPATGASPRTSDEGWTAGRGMPRLEAGWRCDNRRHDNISGDCSGFRSTWKQVSGRYERTKGLTVTIG